MKRTLLFLLIPFFVSSSLFSQEVSTDNATEDKNELKINMTNLIGFKWLDVGYEYILNEESSIGIGILTKIGSDRDDSDGLDEYRTFSLTPYYRHFFSKKYAQGFFVEGFAMLHSGEDEFYNNNSGSYYDEKYTDLAIGVSGGAKFVTKRGFIAEIYLGIGRDMLDQSDIEVVGRGGIALGFRF
ncbi:hypothetical protein SAMN05428642_101444 [Flaviramulus basaltis]|uniref:Outer membrane protein beta-barrel domain-containing protein n=1 Tax=Flaviramulus basaltis TaxID=369401 RepID=A0A1K2IB09_9FLAO|nr:DUF3575 domain-containing protein [Flaviramulus basaltis]SFZ89604.1 hypothetical protein SAMN05428642_101444 [Flaviramulus basaltis]